MDNTFPLSLILSSPIFWKGSKTCEFFTAAHKYIKDTSNERCKAFENILEADANLANWNLWNGHNNWKNVLGDEQFELVTTFLEVIKCDKTSKKIKPRKAKTNWQTSSVVELLGIIRNKHEHNGQYENEAKEKLGWFRNIDGVFQFDPNLYAKYWTDTFPRLTLFLWVYFTKCEDAPTLKCFYPFSLTAQQVDYSNLLNISAILIEALQGQLDKGAVKARYSITRNPSQAILEFQNLPSNQIKQLLGDNLTLSATICTNNICCDWKHKKSNILQTNTFINSPVTVECTKSLLCIFANAVNDLHEHTLDNSDLCRCGTQSTRIVLFTSNCNPEQIQKYVKGASSQFKNISELSVCLSDVSLSIREIVERHAEVWIQGTETKLSSILPISNEGRARCLNSLSGELLNQILKGRSPEIFGKLPMPSVPSNYIKRGLRKTVIVNSQVLKLACRKNVFICVGISKDKLAEIIDCDIADITVFESLPADHEFATSLVILRELNLSEAEKCLKNYNGVNVHVFRFLQEQSFEWLHTHGSCQILKQNCKNFENDRKIITDSSLVEYFESQEKVVAIVDTPGMGKSAFLANLAKQLSMQYSDRVVIHVLASKFLEGLQNMPEPSIEAMINELACSTDFEETLINSWLKQPEPCSKPKIELMLDGLDEANNLHKNLAVSGIKALQLHCPSVRIWLASRNHMLNEIGSHFHSFGYKLIPLSLNEQIDLIVSQWVQSLRKKGDTQTLDMEKLNTFAKQCIEMPVLSRYSDITGIPLLCRMIAEIYEDSIFQSDFELRPIISLNHIYKMLIEKKLGVYLKDKCGILSLGSNHVITNTMRDNFELWHAYYAIKLVFPEQVASKIEAVLQTGIRSLIEVQNAVLEFGLIEKISPITFLHRTFAEFIIARFAIRVLQKSLTNIQVTENLIGDLWDEILNVCVEEPKKTHFVFVSPACLAANITVRKQDPPPTIRYHHSVVNYFLDYYLEPTSLTDDEIGSQNILWELADYFVVTGNEDFYRKMPSAAAARLYNFRNLFFFCLQDTRFIMGMCAIAHSTYYFELLKKLIKLGKYFQPSTWHELKNTNTNKFGMIHLLLFEICNQNRLPDETKFLDYLKFVANLRPDVFEERDENGCTPLLMLAHSVMNFPLYSKLIDYFVSDLRVNIQCTYSYNNTILHYPFKETPEMTGRVHTKFISQYAKLVESVLKYEANRCLLNMVNSLNQTPLISFLQHVSPSLTICLACSKEKETVQNGLCPHQQEYQETIIEVLSIYKHYDTNFNEVISDHKTDIGADCGFPENVISALAQL